LSCHPVPKAIGVVEGLIIGNCPLEETRLCSTRLQNRKTFFNYLQRTLSMGFWNKFRMTVRPHDSWQFSVGSWQFLLTAESW